MIRDCRTSRISAVVLAVVGFSATGCHAPMLREQMPIIQESDVPRELQKMSLPLYRVEPPDILSVNAVHNIRPPTDGLRAGDELVIRVSNALPADPMADPISNQFKVINDIYRVQSNGSVDLGPEYGSVSIDGLSLEDAKAAIEKFLKEDVGLIKPQVAVSMPDVSGKQQISGEHLVRPDGTISLGVYGDVYISGMTLEEAKLVIEMHLSEHIHEPEVTVDVLAYNSKVYYMITDGAGVGETVARIPCTGNETVLDAISQIQGLSSVSSKQIWIARPSLGEGLGAQIMKVDWRGITQDGISTTNYQVFPGDRIYIRGDDFIYLDNFVAKVTAPAERIMGFILFGHGLVRALQFGHLRGGNSSSGVGP